MKQLLFFIFVIFSFFTLKSQVTHNGSISGNPLWTYAGVSQSGGGSPYITLADITATSSGGQAGVNTASGSITSPNLVINASSVISFDGRTFNGYCDPSTSNDIVVEYSEDGGATFTLLAVFEPITNVLTPYSVALPASTVGQNDIQVRFSSGGPTSSTNGNNCIDCGATTGACVVKTAGVDNILITNAALPVTWLQFSAKYTQKAVFLSFSTATEHNNSHFSIERSADGSVFQEIGRVAGKGNSNTKQAYTYTDERPLKGINYYRLRQVDFDGTATYSPVVSVLNGRATGLTVAPSPALDLLNVRFEEAVAEDGRYEIYDMAGRLVFYGAVSAESVEVNMEVAALVPGIYTLRVVNGRDAMTKQFQKE